MCESSLEARNRSKPPQAERRSTHIPVAPNGRRDRGQQTAAAALPLQAGGRLFEPGTAHRREAASEAVFAPSAPLPETYRRGCGSVVEARDERSLGRVRRRSGPRLTDRLRRRPLVRFDPPAGASSASRCRNRERASASCSAATPRLSARSCSRGPARGASSAPIRGSAASTSFPTRSSTRAVSKSTNLRPPGAPTSSSAPRTLGSSSSCSELGPEPRASDRLGIGDRNRRRRQSGQEGS